MPEILVADIKDAYKKKKMHSHFSKMLLDHMQEALADDKQIKQGDKLFKRYIEEHPDSSDDMQGLLVLFDRLEQAKVNSSMDLKKLLDERDELAAQVETLQVQAKQDQERIQELQSQIDQLKNIESIIKNREHK